MSVVLRAQMVAPSMNVGMWRSQCSASSSSGCQLSTHWDDRRATAAKVWFPPFMSKCAWCSNLTAPYLIIVTHGPLLPLATSSKCCSAARHCSHSCRAQHFVCSNVSVLDRVCFCCAWVNGCRQKTFQKRSFLEPFGREPINIALLHITLFGHAFTASTQNDRSTRITMIRSGFSSALARSCRSVRSFGFQCPR
jgi:hypothetical protein